MKNKNILFLCQYFYPEKISSGVLPYELASTLAEQGYHVSALVGYPKEYSDYTTVKHEEKVNNIRVKRIRYIQAKRSNFIGRIVNYIGFCLSILMHPMFFFKNDVFICYTNPPLLPFIVAIFAKIFRKKMIFVIYDLYPDVAIKLNKIKNNSLIAELFKRLNMFVYKNAYKVIVLSNEMKSYLLMNSDLPSDKVDIIPNWYKELNITLNNDNCNKITVIYGGNMGEAQELNTLLKAINILKNNPSIEFHFVGHGTKKEKIDLYIKTNNINNCYIHSFLPKEQYDDLINTASLLVVSLKEEACGLGSPSKVYSYLANAKPILAIMPENTDIVKDIKEYHHGFAVAINDYMKIVDILTNIIGGKYNLVTMGNNSLQLFHDKYTLEKCANKYINIIKEI